jgi:1-acyl-sn-glycerol-3-phosphate acyltransferase
VGLLNRLCRQERSAISELEEPIPERKWPIDAYESGEQPETRYVHDVLRFRTPKPCRLIQFVAAGLNWGFYLRLGGLEHGPARPVLSQQDYRKLTAIPTGAGNILVGPHPGPLDPHVMFYLHAKANRAPSLFLVAEELYYSGTFLRQAVLRRIGAIPVARGRSNPEAIRLMVQHVSQGGWAGIFPEGDDYLSREVMPMEYGAVRIATESALTAQQDARQQIPTGPPRPIFITPFAHAYFFSDRPQTMRRVDIALKELESRAEVFGAPRKGELHERLRHVANRLLEYKAEEYGIPIPEWQDADPFERARKLRLAVLERLEKRYLGRVQEGFARRRALKVRMVIYERLAARELPNNDRQDLWSDFYKTKEIVLSLPFTRRYLNKFDDLEMLVEYVRRFWRVLRMAPKSLGPQDIVINLLPPIDMHAIARHYLTLASPEARLECLFLATEDIRQRIQVGVDEICLKHSVKLD